jgi:hypothetical protein
MEELAAQKEGDSWGRFNQHPPKRKRWRRNYLSLAIIGTYIIGYNGIYKFGLLNTKNSCMYIYIYTNIYIYIYMYVIIYYNYIYIERERVGGRTTC